MIYGICIFGPSCGRPFVKALVSNLRRRLAPHRIRTLARVIGHFLEDDQGVYPQRA
jgi:hypothetical protein